MFEFVSVRFIIVATPFGEVRAGIFVSRAFVCLCCMCFILSIFPLGVVRIMRPLIVALPGLVNVVFA